MDEAKYAAKLATYRANVLSPRVAARITDFTDVVVPVLFTTQDGGPPILSATVGRGPYLLTGHDSRLGSLFIDLMRPEVRDWMVRALHAPTEIHAEIRACPGSALAWWHTRAPVIVTLPPWTTYFGGESFARLGVTERVYASKVDKTYRDVDALQRGVVLTEADGWYVPRGEKLGVGWLPREDPA